MILYKVWFYADGERIAEAFINAESEADMLEIADDIHLTPAFDKEWQEVNLTERGEI